MTDMRVAISIGRAVVQDEGLVAVLIDLLKNLIFFPELQPAWLPLG